MDQDYLLTLAAAPIYAALVAELPSGSRFTDADLHRAAIGSARELLAAVRMQLDAEQRESRRRVQPAEPNQLPASYSAAGVGGYDV